MGENRTRAEPSSTPSSKTRTLLLRKRGQSVALFPIERSKGGGQRLRTRETIIFHLFSSSSRVSLEEETERHARIRIERVRAVGDSWRGGERVSFVGNPFELADRFR